MKIPLCIPNIGEEEAQAVKEVLLSGWLAHGPKTKELEERFARYVGTKYALSLNSCASALHAAIHALELKGEIILPSFTFVASANAIVNAGCKPVFADVDYDSFNLSPEKIKEAITDKTVGIMPVHFAGQSCQMDEIMEIAEKHGLAVIEDSAETIGGEFKGKKTGSFGIGCFSFYPVKNITTGEGGMITTNDEELAEKIKALRGHGISTSTFERERIERPWIRAATMAGYNFRMSDINAAIGLEQMKKLDGMNELRIKHASYLNEGLGALKGIDVPLPSNGCKHVYQMYAVKVAADIRNDFVKTLREKGIGASVHFDPPVHLQPYYSTMADQERLKGTEDLSKREVTLPLYPQMEKKQLDYIAENIRSFLIKN